MSVEVRHGFIKLQTFQNVFLAVPRYDIIKTVKLPPSKDVIATKIFIDQKSLYFVWRPD